ncbi:pyridine nucleotide-disulfide oxidoreductase [Kutzneria sp. 744]|nr:pyridine nucleotide-disulfide oxidoreductase [Kutzneria sp. 744]
MATPLTADVLVVGFGKGGKAAAHALTDAGRRVILVERSENMYGGTCPNVGCVPTKMLVYYSNSRRLEDDAQEFFANSVAGVRKLTTAFRAGNFESLDGKDTATVITGAATFLDPHTVAVGEGDDRITVTAPTILINTGSEPVLPAIPGLADSPLLVSSTELTRATDLPRSLVVIGGGYLGLEFASIYRHFGADVTVIEAADQLLPREDADIASVVTEILTGDGIQVVTGARVVEVADNKVVYTKDRTTHTIEAAAVLPATGRRAVTAGLGLDAAAVRTAPNGSIVVDEHLRTSQPHIFALGDVNGGPQFTYISLDDARIVLDQTPRRRQARHHRPHRRAPHPVHHAAAGHRRPHRARGPRPQPRHHRVAGNGRRHHRHAPRLHRRGNPWRHEVRRRRQHRPRPRRRPAQHRRPGDRQHRRPRHAARHHRHRAPRLDLHPPQLHRGPQRGLRQGRAVAQ